MCCCCCCFVDRPLGRLIDISIHCLHLSQSDGGSGSVITCGIAATLSSELKPKMNVFMIWICDRVFDSFGIGDKCAKKWKIRSSSKKESVAEREGKKRNRSQRGHGHLDTTYGECVVTAI